MCHKSPGSEKSNAITDEELRAALTAYVNKDPSIMYANKPSLRRAAREHARGNVSAVTRYWNERIMFISGQTPAEVKRNQLASIDGLVKKKMGNPDFLGQNHFSESECDSLKEMVVCYGQMGFPYEKTTFASMCQGVARAKLEDQKKKEGDDYDSRLVSQAGDVPDCGESWYRT